MTSRSPSTRRRSRSPVRAPGSPTARADRAPRARRRSRSPVRYDSYRPRYRGRSYAFPPRSNTFQSNERRSNSSSETRQHHARETENDRRSSNTTPRLSQEPQSAQHPSEAAPAARSDTAPEPGPQPSQGQDAAPDDDGWEPYWSDEYGAWWFYNRHTKVTQWENPRVNTASTDQASTATMPARTGAAGSYNPRIHGNWDPNADYAKAAAAVEEPSTTAPTNHPAYGADEYAVTASFNRYTGSFYNPDVHPNRDPSAHTADAQAQRQLLAFMPATEAADQHGGVSLKEQRRNQKLSKEDVQYFKQRNKEKRLQKQRQKWANIG